MIITQTDLINMRITANAPMTREEILKRLIEDDKKSAEYLAALDAERYYKRDQDIKAHDFRKSTIIDRVINDEGKEVDKEVEFSNPNRSNHRMQHRFLFNHVEQKVAYISGREPSITVDGAEPSDDGETGNEQWLYQNELAKTTGAKFRRMLLRWERKASLGGKAWVHHYKDKEGKLRQIVVPRTEGIAIYDTVHDNQIVEFIRHYSVQQTEGRGKAETVTVAEWWTDKEVTEYTSDKNGNFTISQPSRPHYETVTYVNGADGVTQVEKSREGRSWGRAPFVEMANNSDALTDLQVYKDLIDAYDLVASKGTNNLMDFNEFFAIIQGFGGDAASAIVRKLEINRAVSVGAAGAGNNVTMRQLDLQMQGRIDWLKQLWDAIHYFGSAVDPTKDHIGNAASGSSLEFQYSLLDLKAENMITEAESALVEYFWFITENLNRQNGTSYDADLVSIQFNKSRVTNNLETVTMITQSADLLPDKLLLQAHPLVKDADQAYKDLLAEREKKLSRQREMFGTFGGYPKPKNDDDE